MALGAGEADGELAHWASQGFLVRESSTNESAGASSHRATEARCTVGEILLENIHLCPVGVGSDGVRGGAVLANVVGLDVGGVETVKGLDDGGNSLGWLVVLDGSHGLDRGGGAQGRPV